MRSTEEPSGGPRRRSWAFAIVIILFVIMCGMIAWSQWYAINVNVPKYNAHQL